VALHPLLPLLTGARRGAALAIVIALAAPFAGAAEQAGRAVFARGAVTGESVDGTVRVIGKDTPVHEGDVITTGSRSFAVLQLDDGTRMALRPETVFKVEVYKDDPGEESAVMRLFKGGMRTITGFISKRNPDAYKVQTAVATIGIRGTEFDARLCTDDCRTEAERLAAAARSGEHKVIGRVAFVRGELTGTAASGTRRAMVLGAPLYDGDTVTTAAGAMAVLAFRDETRITLSGDTAFQIEAARFPRDDPAEGSTAFRLLRGGLRAVTGLIARRNPSAVRFRTPVATIGIRGTGFDLLCQDTCGETPVAAVDPSLRPRWLSAVFERLIPAAVAQVPAAGLYAQVWSGSILMQFGGREQTVGEGQIGFLDPSGRQFNFVPQLPVPFTAPRPDQVPVDQQKLFEIKTKEEVEPGLYVSCITGHCSVDDLNLGEGEASFKGGEDASAERIEPPPVLTEDPYFKTVDPNMEPLLETLGGESGEALECEF